MRETGREQQQQEVHLPSDSTVVTFAFGPVGHCFLCCNQFLSTVMWNLRFPLFWSYMWFTMLKTRPVNIDRKQTCSSMPDLLTHFTSPDAGSQAVFLFRKPTRLLKRRANPPIRMKKSLYFQVKSSKLILRDIRLKVRWLWSCLLHL